MVKFIYSVHLLPFLFNKKNTMCSSCLITLGLISWNISGVLFYVFFSFGRGNSGFVMLLLGKSGIYSHNILKAFHGEYVPKLVEFINIWTNFRQWKIFLFLHGKVENILVALVAFSYQFLLFPGNKKFGCLWVYGGYI